MSKVLRDLFSRTPLTPTPRRSHESALVDGHLFLFGGSSHSTFFPRHEIWSMNVCVATSKRKWIRHLTQSREIPPPCRGAQCVEIDKMLYSYGGEKKDGDLLGDVYRLDLKEMVWIKVATPVEKKRPISRESCCLSVVGSRFIMFGGWTYKMPCDEFQSGASQSEGKWNNEIYEFVFEEKRQKGESSYF
ncbi:actin-fragmin kinase-like [Oscarella lobularis]|uniref:actin-fragmin kinase-like n=1 Tax=Oscarella lobularis TaxID=121494 RepID=UPI003313C825